MKRKINNIIFISLFILCILGIANNVFAIEQTRTLEGREVTEEEFLNPQYEREFSEDGQPVGTLRAFLIPEEYPSKPDYFSAGEPGGCEKGTIIEMDYIGKSFRFESYQYLGESFTINDLGTFNYSGKEKSLIFEERTYYIYNCKITNNDFKRNYGEVRYFELIETDLLTNKQYLNQLCLSFEHFIVIEDNDTGIKLEGTTKELPLDTKMVTKNINEDEIKILDKNKNNFIAYDITLKSNDIEIQPNNNIKITIPVPDNFDGSDLIVYRIEGENKIEYKVTINEIENKKYATFETYHFSTYVLAETKKIEENNAPTQEPESTPENKPEETPPVESPKTQENIEKILDDEPKTGEKNSIFSILIVLNISTIGIIILIKKMYK